MTEYLETLKTYFSETNPAFGCDKVDSVLDVLHCCFRQRLIPDTEAIKTRFAALDDILSGLPLKDRDKVTDLTCQLCEEHQKDSFRQGLLAGFHLFRDLRE